MEGRETPGIRGAFSVSRTWMSGESGASDFFAGDSTSVQEISCIFLMAVVWSVAAGVVPLTRFWRSEFVLGWFQTWLAGRSLLQSPWKKEKRNNSRTLFWKSGLFHGT